jgi:prolyl 4-hydroxylase
MKKHIDDNWKKWIKLNIARGCDKVDMTEVLLEQGFSETLITEHLKYQPTSEEVLKLINQYIVHSRSKNSNPVNLTPSFQDTDDLYLPLAKKIDTDKLNMYLLDDFLSSNECNEIIKKIQKHCRPSTITNPKDNDTQFRTSQTCDLCINPDEFIKDLDRRIADYMGIELKRSEGIQGQYYQVGNQFKTHTDYFQPDSPEYEQYATEMGQRTWTFMIYLNDVEEGGHTEFPAIKLSVKPKRGQAVIWNSLHANGEVNPGTSHWATPILKGEKYVITKWFRIHGRLDNHFKLAAYKKLPIFTDEGFIKECLPKEIYQKILSFYENNKINKIDKSTQDIGAFIHTEKKYHSYKMIELTNGLRKEILDVIQPMLERWAKQKLLSTAVYGIREYNGGTILDMHVDRLHEHVISVIINVDQIVEKVWPLYIYDHMSRLHKVILKPGDILFYESAKLLHGMPEAFQGQRYATIFAHSKPDDWANQLEKLSIS